MSRRITCACCGRTGTHRGRSLIVACYQRHWSAGTLRYWPAIRTYATYTVSAPAAIGHVEDYAELRSQGVPRTGAARRLGVTVRTISRYAAYLRTHPQESTYA